MKHQLIISCLLAIMATACGTGDTATAPAATSPQGDALSTIMTRTSVREYTGQAVTDQQVETMLRAAMAAPTAVNRQPWAFVVIKDRNKLNALADSIGSMKMAAKAQVAIAVCGDMTRALDGAGHDFWIQDVSAATENLLLAAHAQGLGAVWCGVYPSPERVATVSDLLGLPDEIVPLAIVPVGYPEGTPTPKEKWDSTKVHVDKW